MGSIPQGILPCSVLDISKCLLCEDLPCLG